MIQKKLIYNYNIVQYYPNILSGEFINIGIICGNEDTFDFLFLSEEHIEQINCNYLIQKKKVLKPLISYIKEELDNKSTINEIHENFYFNNFSFSKNELMTSYDDLNSVIKDLFFQYIGYKFVKEEKKEKRIIVKEMTIYEIEKHFSKYFSYEIKDNYYDLVLNRKDKKEQYKTIIGSLLNEHDISRATKAYINSYSSKSIFSYFNSENEMHKHNKKFNNTLNFLKNKIEMEPISFYNEDKISKGLEKLLQ